MTDTLALLIEAALRLTGLLVAGFLLSAIATLIFVLAFGLQSEAAEVETPLRRTAP